MSEIEALRAKVARLEGENAFLRLVVRAAERTAQPGTWLHEALEAFYRYLAEQRAAGDDDQPIDPSRVEAMQAEVDRRVRVRHSPLCPTHGANRSPSPYAQCLCK